MIHPSAGMDFGSITDEVDEFLLRAKNKPDACQKKLAATAVYEFQKNSMVFAVVNVSGNLTWALVQLSTNILQEIHMTTEK